MSFVSSSLLLVSSEAPGNAFFTHTLRCPQQCQQSESSWSTMDNIIPNKYIFCYFLHLDIPGVSLDGGAIWADEELLKVPGDVCPPDRPPDQELRVGHQTLRVIAGGGQRLLQELEDRMLIFAIGLNLWIKNLCLHENFSSSWFKIPTLSNNSPLNSNPFPGLTCLRALTISCPPEFSWWPN